MAIDVEYIDSLRQFNLILNLSANKKTLVEWVKQKNTEKMTLLWTAKEALSKALKTGLAANQNIFEIANFDKHNQYIEISFKSFYQYKVISWRSGDYA